jgi:hypothetical protein
MYKYEVYKNQNVSRILRGSFKDEARYNKGAYVFERTLNPIDKDLSFRWTKTRMFFRKNLEGAFVLDGEDFDWFNEIRQDAVSSSYYRYVKVSEKKDGVWEEVWRGFLSVSNGKWDLDKCSVEVSNLLVWDKYTAVLENIEREKNFFISNAGSIYYSIDEYEYDTVIITESETVSGANVSLGSPSGGELLYGFKYVLFKKTQEVVNAGALNATYSTTYEYRRDYINQVNDPGPDWEKASAEPIYGTNDVYHWVRYYRGNDSPTFNCNVYGIQFYGLNDELGIEEGVCTMVHTPVEEVENDRARLFSEICLMLTYDLLESGAPYVKSSFFNDSNNPVTGEENELNAMWLVQMSDMKETSDPATRAFVTIKDLETWLSFFKVGWYIDSDGFFRMEHQKYFDNGLTYSTPEVGVDLLETPEILLQAKSKNKFKFNNSLPRIIEVVLQDAGGDDFYGTPIIYIGNMANWQEESKNVISINNLVTDINLAATQDTSKDGFLLAATKLEDGKFNVIRDTGILTNGLVYNEPLSVSAIQDAFWRWGANAPIGIINKVKEDFDDYEKRFVQEEITVAWCDDFDPYKRVRTEYGLGRVESASCTLKDKKLTLSLYY